MIVIRAKRQTAIKMHFTWLAAASLLFFALTTPFSPVQAQSRAPIDLPVHEAQSFNNCGPATLSMMLNWAGVQTNQQILGNQIRPYQVTSGDNDDKSVSSEEFVIWAEEYGMYAINRPNGTPEMLKRFTDAGIPVVIKSWLHPNEDIGHFRIITGYNDVQQVFYQDDSYDGPNLTLSYADLPDMWEPFQNQYFIVVSPERKAEVESIVGEDIVPETAWYNLFRQSAETAMREPRNPYARFNIAIALYNLGHMEETVVTYEDAAERLPRRMLWYQIEPLRAYAALGNRSRVFELTDSILNDQNRAFSELYVLRGDMYEEEGNIDAARREYETAVRYNENLSEARQALDSLLQS